MNKHQKWRLRSYVNKLGLLNLFEFIQSASRYYRKIPHEEDFYFFSFFQDSTDVFCDIGANVGQSAYSFSIFNHSAPIYSFEINPLLEKQLLRAKKILGKRFHYFKHGFAASAGELILYYPCYRGFSFWQEATTDPNFLNLEDTLKRMELVTGSRDFELRQVKVQVKTFDELNLRPRIIKIDTQGTEYQILQGMKQTLKNSQPVLLIESEAQVEEIRCYLEAFDYMAYTFDVESRTLLRADFSKSLNLFYVANSQIETLKEKGVRFSS